jgi:hypothetical protein
MADPVALTVQGPKRIANTLTMGAASADGNTFPNTGKELVVIKNASVAPITLTVDVVAKVDDMTVADRTVTLGAGETHYLGPWPKAVYNDDNGNVKLTYSGVVTLTLAVIRPS